MNAYEREPYRAELEVVVVDRGVDGKRRYVVLDETILYPEGGGQPSDHGWIGEVAVVDVQRGDGDIRHYVDGAVDLGTALLRLDWERRFDHMQQHTAQHLITALAADELGWQTTSFHLGETLSDVELAVAEIADADLARLERCIAEHVRSARVVTTRRVTPETLESLDVRTRGLPEGHRGDVRLVEIDGVDCNTCGGTHLASTAEIEAVVLLGTEPMRGGTRLHWIAGERVRRRLHERERQVADVRRAFETSDDELLEVAAAKLDRLKSAEREIKSLRGRLAKRAAAEIAASAGDVLEGHFEPSDAGFLRLVARELLEVEDGRAALLTAEGPSGGFFVVCAAPRPGLDLRPVGGEIAEVLGGRGGGSAELIQGKAGSLERRADARALLERHLSSDR